MKLNKQFAEFLISKSKIWNSILYASVRYGYIFAYHELHGRNFLMIFLGLTGTQHSYVMIEKERKNVAFNSIKKAKIRAIERPLLNGIAHI